MKKHILSTLIVIFGIAPSFSQGIEVVSSLNTSPNTLFQGAYGWGLNYQFKPIDSLIQFGVAFHQYNCTTQYQIDNPIYDQGFVYTGSYDITSKVKRTSYRFNSLAILRENKYMFWAIGTDVSYNIIMGHSDALSYYMGSNNYQVIRHYSYDYGTIHAIGAGIFTKVEIRNVFSPKLSLCFNIRPELIYIPRSSIFDYAISPGNIGFIEFQLGLKYNFHKII